MTGTGEALTAWALILGGLALALAVAIIIVNIIAAGIRRSWHTDVDEPIRHARRRHRGGRHAR